MEGGARDSQNAIFQPVSAGWRAGATNPTNRPSIHPSTSAPARIWPQVLAGWLGLTMMGDLINPILEGSIAGGGAMPS